MTRTYRRATGVVWRAGPDRVLVHRVGADPITAAHDLTGGVAFVWLALDEPGTIDDLATRLAEADLVSDDLAAELALLIDAGLLVVG